MKRYILLPVVLMVLALLLFASTARGGTAPVWHADGVAVSAKCSGNAYVVTATIDQSDQWPGAFVVSITPSSFPGTAVGTFSVVVVIGWPNSSDTQKFTRSVTLSGECAGKPCPVTGDCGPTPGEPPIIGVPPPGLPIGPYPGEPPIIGVPPVAPPGDTPEVTPPGGVPAPPVAQPPLVIGVGPGGSTEVPTVTPPGTQAKPGKNPTGSAPAPKPTPSAAKPVAQESEEQAAATLPFTGMGLWGYALMGALLIGLGASLLRFTR